MDRERRITDRGRAHGALADRSQIGAHAAFAAGELAAYASCWQLPLSWSIQDPRERPADAREAADNAHALFADPRSEFIGVLKLWDAYQAEARSTHAVAITGLVR